MGNLCCNNGPTAPNSKQDSSTPEHSPSHPHSHSAENAPKHSQTHPHQHERSDRSENRRRCVTYVEGLSWEQAAAGRGMPETAVDVAAQGAGEAQDLLRFGNRLRELDGLKLGNVSSLRANELATVTHPDKHTRDLQDSLEETKAKGSSLKKGGGSLV